MVISITVAAHNTNVLQLITKCLYTSLGYSFQRHPAGLLYITYRDLWSTKLQNSVINWCWNASVMFQGLNPLPKRLYSHNMWAPCLCARQAQYLSCLGANGQTLFRMLKSLWTDHMQIKTLQIFCSSQWIFVFHVLTCDTCDIDIHSTKSTTQNTQVALFQPF